MSDQQSSIIQDLSKSIGQYCDQMSFINVTVPIFEKCQNVFDFLTEYEVVTSTLSDQQRISLLVKSFKRGRTRCWFETELAPLIEKQEPWENIKKTIISRFSDTEDRDRHFKRLREIKFDPSKGQSLLDFVEEIIYSYRKAYPSERGDENCIKFVKAAIPDELRSKLNLEQDFRSANTIEQFKGMIKRYDSGLSFSCASNSKSNNEELTAMIKLLYGKIELMDKENKATREAVNAALSSNNRNYQNYMQKSYHRDQNSPRYRPDSDARNNYVPRDKKDANRSPINSRSSTPERDAPDSDYSRTSEDKYRRKKDKTSRRFDRSRYDSDRRSPRPTHSETDKHISSKDRAFNDEIYYQKFGKPPTPCVNCDTWHWARHCPKENLK